MKKLFLITLMLFFLSCKKNKDSAEVFYLHPSTNSHIPIDCNLINTMYGLKRIEITEKEIINIIKNKINKLDNSSNDNNIDVRAKLIINRDTLCIDNFNNVLLNGIRKNNSKDLVKIIKKYINQNQSKAIIINDHPIFELIDNGID